MHTSRIYLRSGELSGWSALSGPGKARSKHGAVFAGGALFMTSGVYPGQPGSNENKYAALNNDGSIGSWNGATGSETISAETGISVYNQAVVTFVDAAGAGHVLVLGGANRLLLSGRAGRFLSASSTTNRSQAPTSSQASGKPRSGRAPNLRFTSIAHICPSGHTISRSISPPTRVR